VDWLSLRGYRNCILEVCNGCDSCRSEDECSLARKRLPSLIWEPTGKHGLFLDHVRSRASDKGSGILLSSSYVEGNLPMSKELHHVDYLSLQTDLTDGSLQQMTEAVRALLGFPASMPVVFTGTAGSLLFEDCTPGSSPGCPLGNVVAARTSWGLQIPCCSSTACSAGPAGYRIGASFQCPPINWAFDSSEAKQSYFDALLTATSAPTAAAVTADAHSADQLVTESPGPHPPPRLPRVSSPPPLQPPVSRPPHLPLPTLPYPPAATPAALPLSGVVATAVLMAAVALIASSVLIARAVMRRNRRTDGHMPIDTSDEPAGDDVQPQEADGSTELDTQPQESCGNKKRSSRQRSRQGCNEHSAMTPDEGQEACEYF